MEYRYEPKDDRDFTKMFHEELQKVTKLRLKGELSLAGELLFRTLGDYVDFSGDNIVKNNSEAMGTKTIGEKLLGYGKSQTIALVNELINLNLIAKVKRGKNVIYVINPIYFNKGKVLKSTVTLFRVKTDDIEWDKEFLEV
jgi:S-adenosylmethionine:tRNA-ribosyltransferase-isomerase (queuine synthetase)